MLKPAPSTSEMEFSMSQARHLIGDLFKAKPWIYWTDFLTSMIVGTICFGMIRPLVQWYGLFSWQVIATFAVQCLLYYRCATFIHELTHLPKDKFAGFRFAWNMLCGIPFLMPSFVYHTHAEHHRRKHYGTLKDGEYLPLGNRHPICILLYLSESFIIGPAAVFRWLILTPLTWLHPKIRDLVYERASSMVINPLYARPLPNKNMIRMIRLQETLTFLWCLGWIVIPGLFGKAMIDAGLAPKWEAWWLIPPIPLLLQAYVTSVVILLLNSLRTVASHRWYNEWAKEEPEMTFVEQLLDSVNYPRNPMISELWGPIGMRFHALHHLFPSLPYHAMPAAHKRLMEGLPADSPYRLTNERSLSSGLIHLWKRAAASRSRKEVEAKVPAGV